MRKKQTIKGVFENLPRLETDRLILRQIEEKDQKDVFEFASDPETARYTSWEAHKYPEESKHLIKFMRKRYKANKPSNWAVILKDGNRFIGTCGFTSEYRAHKRGEIGFGFRKDSWNKGYATEAVKKTIEFGFNVLGYNRIEAFVDAENKASVRVLEKCGMKYEGTLRQYVLKNGSFRDMMSYAVMKDDLPGKA